MDNNNTNKSNVYFLKIRHQAKTSRLPISKTELAEGLSFDELCQLSDALELIRQARQKCNKNTAMDAYLRTVVLALTGAIAQGMIVLNGESQ